MTKHSHQRFEPRHGIIAVKGATLCAAPWEDGAAIGDPEASDPVRDMEAERRAVELRRVRVAELCASGMKGSDICAELNIKRPTLDSDLHKLGMRLRTTPKRKRADLAEIKTRRAKVNALFQAGANQREICEKLGLRPHIVRADMHLMNLSPMLDKMTSRRAMLKEIYRDDLTIAQIAEALGCSIDTARQDLRAVGLRKKKLPGRP